MADPARHELEAGRFTDSHSTDTGMQNAAANAWARESSHTWARNAINRGADPNLVLNAALQQDIYQQSNNVYRASDAFQNQNSYPTEQQYITTPGGGLILAPQPGSRPTAERSAEPATNPANAQRAAESTTSPTTQPRTDWYANHGEREHAATRPSSGMENYAKQHPTLKHPEDLRVANTEIAQSMGSMSQAVGDIMRGDYDGAMRELKGSLQKMDSGTQDLKSAFDGVVPGQESWTSAQERINKAIQRLQDGKYDDCITTIGTALTDMRKGRSDVQQASQPQHRTPPRQ